MKISLVLTTINVPKVLPLYRACDPNVQFYVMGDLKTPDLAVCELLNGIPNCRYYSYDQQADLGYRCHAAIGPNCLQRRNIGFLEALKGGADAVVTIDDDNMPIDRNYFAHYETAFRWPFDGIKVSGKEGWFDPGQFLVPPVVQRGFPIQVKHRPKFEPVTGAVVGVASGLILGDSDMDAYTRIGKAPTVGDVAMLAQACCVVDPQTYTIFNSQNSAVRRELMPAYFMMPGVGRYDDVFASLIVQRVAREGGYHVRLGQPLVLQERNEHDLMADLYAEVAGMQHVKAMADLLDSIPLPGRNVMTSIRTIYETLAHAEFIPAQAVTAAMAWLEDCKELGL